MLPNGTVDVVPNLPGFPVQRKPSMMDIRNMCQSLAADVQANYIAAQTAKATSNSISSAMSGIIPGLAGMAQGMASGMTPNFQGGSPQGFPPKGKMNAKG